MRAILKQTSWLFLAQVITRTIGFFYTIFLARNLGVSNFGVYSAAFAYFSLFSAVADFGFNRFLVKEIALNKKKTSELLYNVNVLRLILTILLLLIFGTALYLFDPDKIRVSLTLLLSLAVIPQAIGLTFDGAFIALKKLQYSSVSIIIASLATSFLGFILVSNKFGLVGVAIAIILGQLAYALSFILIAKRQNIAIFKKVILEFLKKAAIGSFPYAVLTVLGIVYFRLSLLLLSYIKGDFDTGIYGVAYRFLEAVVIFPSALSIAFFPIFAQSINAKSLNLQKLYFKAILILLSISIFMSLGFIGILPKFIELFLPQYKDSIEVVKILGLSIPFFFLNSLQSTYLLSQNKFIKHLILISVLIICFIFISNLIFLPKFSYIGAAWVTVVSELIIFVVFYLLIRREFKS